MPSYLAKKKSTTGLNCFKDVSLVVCSLAFHHKIFTVKLIEISVVTDGHFVMSCTTQLA